MQSESQLAELLIVEDNKRLAELAKEYLEKNGYKVGIENRGDTAVNRIINEQPDLLILDLMLPGLDGMDICKQVRENLKFNNPILMLTARVINNKPIIRKNSIFLIYRLIHQHKPLSIMRKN